MLNKINTIDKITLLTDIVDYRFDEVRKWIDIINIDQDNIHWLGGDITTGQYDTIINVPTDTLKSLCGTYDSRGAENSLMNIIKNNANDIIFTFRGDSSFHCLKLTKTGVLTSLSSVTPSEIQTGGHKYLDIDNDYALIHASGSNVKYMLNKVTYTLTLMPNNDIEDVVKVGSKYYSIVYPTNGGGYISIFNFDMTTMNNVGAYIYRMSSSSEAAYGIVDVVNNEIIVSSVYGGEPGETFSYDVVKNVGYPVKSLFDVGPGYSIENNIFRYCRGQADRPYTIFVGRSEYEYSPLYCIDTYSNKVPMFSSVFGSAFDFSTMRINAPRIGNYNNSTIMIIACETYDQLYFNFVAIIKLEVNIVTSQSSFGLSTITNLLGGGNILPLLLIGVVAFMFFKNKRKDKEITEFME